MKNVATYILLAAGVCALPAAAQNEQSSQACLAFASAFGRGENVAGSLVLPASSRDEAKLLAALQTEIVGKYGPFVHARVDHDIVGEKLVMAAEVRCGEGLPFWVLETSYGPMPKETQEWDTAELLVTSSRPRITKAGDPELCRTFDNVVMPLVNNTPLSWDAGVNFFPQPDTSGLVTRIRQLCSSPDLRKIGECGDVTNDAIRVVRVTAGFEKGGARVECAVEGSRVIGARIDSVGGTPLPDEKAAEQVAQFRRNIRALLPTLKERLDSLKTVTVGGETYVRASDARSVLTAATRAIAGTFPSHMRAAGANAAAYVAQKAALPPLTAVRVGDEPDVQVVTRSWIDRATAVITQVILRFAEAESFTPSLWVRSTPSEAEFILGDGGDGRPPIYTDNSVQNVWLGTYNAYVRKVGYKPIRFTVDLIDDPRTDIRCTLVAAKSTESSFCKLFPER